MLKTIVGAQIDKRPCPFGCEKCCKLGENLSIQADVIRHMAEKENASDVTTEEFAIFAEGYSWIVRFASCLMCERGKEKVEYLHNHREVLLMKMGIEAYLKNTEETSIRKIISKINKEEMKKLEKVILAIMDYEIDIHKWNKGITCFACGVEHFLNTYGIFIALTFYEYLHKDTIAPLTVRGGQHAITN